MTGQRYSLLSLWLSNGLGASGAATGSIDGSSFQPPTAERPGALYLWAPFLEPGLREEVALRDVFGALLRDSGQCADQASRLEVLRRVLPARSYASSGQGVRTL